MEFLELGEPGSARIKVVGVGGGGGNAVNNMISSSLQGVTFIAANTDLQALGRSQADVKIQLGDKLTKGLGAGGNPQAGQDAAMESLEAIREAVGDSDMVFVTAGMGGGTGTGAAPVIAQAAREMGALTVGVVTKPFYFEGKRRMDAAERGILAFREHVDSLITIPNDRLLTLAPKKAAFIDMLKKSDEVLYHAVRGISDLIMVPGLINLDFADVRAVMGEAGLAMMGAGVASGESRAREAAMKAITSPLLEDVSIDGARGVLMNVTASYEVTMEEVAEAMSIIEDASDEDAQIFFGVVFDDSVEDEIRITVIATGIEPKGVHMGDSVGGTVKMFPSRGGAANHAPGGVGPGFGGGQASAQQACAAAQPGAWSLQGEEGVGVPRPVRSYADGNRDVPAVMRMQGGARAATREAQRGNHAPGENDFVFDEDEFEIPSFIRKQAD